MPQLFDERKTSAVVRKKGPVGGWSVFIDGEEVSPAPGWSMKEVVAFLEGIDVAAAIDDARPWRRAFAFERWEYPSIDLGVVNDHTPVAVLRRAPRQMVRLALRGVIAAASFPLVIFLAALYAVYNIGTLVYIAIAEWAPGHFLEHLLLAAASAGTWFLGYTDVRIFAKGSGAKRQRAAARGLDVFEAAKYGDAGRLKELLSDDQGLARRWSKDGWTALHTACRFGQAEAAYLLLGWDNVETIARRHGVTPLQAAIKGGTPGALKTAGLLLFEGGADPNTRGFFGYTALHYAATTGSLDLTRLLLERGADATARTESGATLAELTENDELRALLPPGRVRARGVPPRDS